MLLPFLYLMEWSVPTFLVTANGLAVVSTLATLETLDGAIFNTVQTLGTTAVNDGGAAIWAALTPPQTANGTTIVAGANGSYFGKIAAGGGSGGATTLAALTDVNVSEGAAINGYSLAWNQASGKWTAQNITGGSGGGIPLADRSINAAFDYGVDPTGATDSTTALQNAINAAIAQKKALYIPGTPKIAGNVNIGANTSTNLVGFHMYGDGRENSVITCSGTNVPMFKINAALMHSCRFEGLGFEYATMQTGANASVFSCLGTSSSSFYNSVWEDVRAQNMNMFMTCTGCSWWGMKYEDCWFGDMSGGVNNISWGAGEPRSTFHNIYINCPSAVGPLFTHNAMTAEYFVEVNGATSGPQMLVDQGGGRHIIKHWALEVATYSAAGNTMLFECENSCLFADYIYFNTLTIGSGATVYGFHCEENSNVSYFSVKLLEGTNWTNSGAFYASDSPGGHKCHFGQISLPWAANCALTVATFQAQNVCVDDWNDETYVNFLTNTATQTALNYASARTNILNATLSQASTIIIPDSTAVPANLYDGRRFTFVKTNLAPFLFTIKSTNGTTIATIPASLMGKIELMFDAGTLNAWVVMESTTFS